jgi:hypothetical protein
VRARFILGQLVAAAAVLALAVVLGFYLNRVFAPLPLYAGDEGAYLIRALYAPEVYALNPFVQEVGNGLYFLVIRAVRALSLHYLEWLRLIGLAGYVGGLLMVWRSGVAALPRPERQLFLFLALAFPYYRFVVTTLPEGLYVLWLGALAAATALAYRSRPMLWSGVAGVLLAALVLTKPHGLAVGAAVGVVVAVDAILTRRVMQGLLRLAVIGAAFLVAGNLIQGLAHLPTASPLLFFYSGFYGAALGSQPAPDGEILSGLTLLGMLSTLALFAAPPILAGLADIWARQRAGEREPTSHDLMFALLLLALAATVAMVTIFAFKISASPGETRRVWGRYFEFFVPLLWLAAAPYLVRQGKSRALRLASAGVMSVGLGGLMLSFRADVVPFPWDTTALNAFFQTHAERANLGRPLRYRALGIAASLAAILLLALGVKAPRVGAAYLLALALISTHLDDMWIGGMAGSRAELDWELKAAAGRILQAPGKAVVLVGDNNDAHNSFLELDGRVAILPATTPPEALAAYDKVVTVRDVPAPPAPFAPVYTGWQLKVYERPASTAASAP